jgi:chromosome segregation ATPase
MPESAGPSPDAQLAQLDAKVQAARHDIESVSGDIDSVQQRIGSLQHESTQFTDEVQQLGEHVRHEVESAGPALHADVSLIEQELHKMEQSIQSQLAELKEAADTTIASFGKLATSVTDLVHAFDSERGALVQRAVQSATALEQLVQSLGEHATSTAKASMSACQHGVGQLEEASSQSFNAIHQAFETQMQSQLVDGVSRTGGHMQDLTRSFARELQQHGSELSAQVERTWGQFSGEQEARVTRMAQEAENLARAVETVLSKVQDIGTSAVKSTETVVEGVDAVNVGFKVTIGTLDNVRSILSEIHL